MKVSSKLPVLERSHVRPLNNISGSRDLSSTKPHHSMSSSANIISHPTLESYMPTFLLLFSRCQNFTPTQLSNAEKNCSRSVQTFRPSNQSEQAEISISTRYKRPRITYPLMLYYSNTAFSPSVFQHSTYLMHVMRSMGRNSSNTNLPHRPCPSVVPHHSCPNPAPWVPLVVCLLYYDCPAVLSYVVRPVSLEPVLGSEASKTETSEPRHWT
ncbi:uncharacterized protein B0T23DRAFT_224656 [Neurospora hispaniola]|uniref:Uncharacterized protein n=1 Tax=Neurospora hispaniola TaxID=588809 RepID=A0AAJ0I2N7_9PEZI|nr:hypothetical protein B0T23DRAFT_224656 [Neurospora hispaniola]